MKAAMRGRLGWLWILAGFTVGLGAIVEKRAVIIVGVTLMVLIMVIRWLGGRSDGVLRPGDDDIGRHDRDK
jgi:hypothetical protein